MKIILKTTLSKNPQVKVRQPFAIFVVDEDTLVVLVLLGMHPKRFQPLSQRRLGLKNQRSLTTKDPKGFGYPKFLNFLLCGSKEEIDSKKKEESLLGPSLPPQLEQGESSQGLPGEWKFAKNHLHDQIIEFSKSMHSEFDISMMGELNFFLGLQIKQLKEGTNINQEKCIRDLLKKFPLEEVKTKSTPMSSSFKLDMNKERYAL